MPSMRQQRKMWYYFGEASLRTVYSSKIPLSLTPWPSQTNQPFWLPVEGAKKHELSIKSCNTQIDRLSTGSSDD